LQPNCATFMRGGGVADGVHLVELLERAGVRTLIATLRKETNGRGSRLPADCHPSHSEFSFALDRGMPQACVSSAEHR
jgi:hypothetical protein